MVKNLSSAQKKKCSVSPPEVDHLVPHLSKMTTVPEDPTSRPSVQFVEKSNYVNHKKQISQKSIYKNPSQPEESLFPSKRRDRTISGDFDDPSSLVHFQQDKEVQSQTSNLSSAPKWTFFCHALLLFFSRIFFYFLEHCRHPGNFTNYRHFRPNF